MIDIIKLSVGLNARNERSDVFIVQELINHYASTNFEIPTIKIDGFSGPGTENAISVFQKEIVGLKYPDSKIDSPGKTERIMSEKLKQDVVKRVVSKYRSDIKIVSDITQINYRQNARREVSQFSENVIKLCMKFSRLEKIDFSSTRRTISDQARIMYNNCKNSNTSSVSALRAKRGWGYGVAGRAVEQVYFDNSAQPKMDVRKDMEDKINEYLKQNKYTSRHCVTLGAYQTRNVIDIPYSSIAGRYKDDFENNLCSMSKIIKKKNRSPYKGKHQFDLIDKIIVEGSCFHVEISQSIVSPIVKAVLSKIV